MKGFWGKPDADAEKPFGRTPLFYLIAAVLGLALASAAFLVGKSVENKTCEKTRIQSAERTGQNCSNQALADLTPSPQMTVSSSALPPAALQSENQNQSEYFGWSLFDDKGLDFKISYPPTWVATSEQDKKVVHLRTGDDKYHLYFGLTKKGSESQIEIDVNLPEGEHLTGGTLTILDTKITKTKIVDGGKTKAYLYPEDPATSSDSQWVFAGEFIASIGTEYANIDMDNLDERAVVEKILKSVEIK